MVGFCFLRQNSATLWFQVVGRPWCILNIKSIVSHSSPFIIDADFSLSLIAAATAVNMYASIHVSANLSNVSACSLWQGGFNIVKPLYAYTWNWL